MGRNLIYIPKMFSREEFKELTGVIPEDFNEVAKEFWDYVEEKLRPFSGNVQRVYCKEPVSDVRERLKIFEGSGEYAIVRLLVKDGAELVAVEDPLLVAETEAWFEMMKSLGNQGASELYEDSMKKRDEHITTIINQTLKDGEIGVLLIDSGHKLSLAEDIKVVKMCRFEPEDYLKRWLTKLRLGK